MAAPPGTYELGQDTGTLELRTYREGLAQAAGHDLVLEATRWHGTAEVREADPPEVTVDVTVDLAGLVVREGRGGLVPLTDRDRSDIGRNLRRILSVDRHPDVRFHASTVTGMVADETSATLSGDLTLAGRAAPLDVRVVASPADGGTTRVTGSATLRQTAWGVKPYSGLFGALKLKDEVAVSVTVNLRPRPE